MAKGWSGPEEALLKEMYARGCSYEQIASSLARTTDACRHKGAALGLKARGKGYRVMPKPEEVSAAAGPYQAGWMQRINGGRKVSPYIRGKEHWRWLAGWHDADMEQGVSYLAELERKAHSALQ